ncbi:MAG: family 10 glycosylhydrolase [Anaerolineae bacterium]|nr:family 10 glycosylhydrolase [Anaerolineae bacterium]
MLMWLKAISRGLYFRLGCVFALLLIMGGVSFVALNQITTVDAADVDGQTFDTLAGLIGRVDAWYFLAGEQRIPSARVNGPVLSPQTAIQPPGTGTIYPPVSPTIYLPVIMGSYTPPLVERRAVWVTRYDWTSSYYPVTAESVDQIVSNVAAAGFNTIFFQVRAAGDAYYAPGLEPWAARLTGSPAATLGQDPGWDPLEYMLTVAHAAGLEVHAYVNVYPAWLSPAGEQYGELWPPATSPPHMFDRFTYGPDYVDHPGEYGLGMKWRQYDSSGSPMPLSWGQYLWASPGVDQVQEHINRVIRDIVIRYPVDGVHLDLVRYAGVGYSYDPATTAATGTMSGPARAQWQRDRITDLVQRIYNETHTLRPGVWVSAAVWPYYEDKWGWGLSEGYSDYYQDSKGWLQAGIVDAIAPMLYGNGNSIPDNFSRWCILMEDFVVDSGDRHVYPGIAGYYDNFEAISQRIEAARSAGAPGHAVFSYGALQSRDYWDEFAAGPYASPAILPGKSE